MTTYCDLGKLDGSTVSGGRPENLIDLGTSYSVAVADGSLGTTPISTQSNGFLRVRTETTPVKLSRSATPASNEEIYIGADETYECWVGNISAFYLLPVA